MDKINIGIVGATGYTGSELVRILSQHPQAHIAQISSESYAGQPFSAVHPAFRQIQDQKLVNAEDIRHDLDVVFLALPHGVSMEFVEKWQSANFRIIDLSGDFRLDNAETYYYWYDIVHTYEAGFAERVYGLPELAKAQIAKSRLIANPGCYPTSAILGILPLLKHHLVDPHTFIVDAKSGVTGAGIKPKPNTHFPQVYDNFSAYGLINHRHTGEIQETLRKVSRQKVEVLFTPHLLPVDRGILSTIYAQTSTQLPARDLIGLYQEYYADDPFVRICTHPPGIKEVRGTNYCDIHPAYDPRTGRYLIISVIDNLVKGAAGQAVHNMNLLFGLPETTGLQAAPLHP